MNKSILVGRMVREADLRYTPAGDAVANFTVAVNRPFRNKNGEQEADFINCVTWRKQAENLAQYTGKGSMIAIEGRIQTRSYEGKDGKMVYVTEVLAENIQYLDNKKSGKAQQPKQQRRIDNMNKNLQQNAQEIDVEESDLPF